MKNVFLLFIFSVLTVLLCSCGTESDSSQKSIWQSDLLRPYASESVLRYVVLGEYNGVKVEKLGFEYDLDTKFEEELLNLYPDEVKITKCETPANGCLAKARISFFCDGEICQFADREEFEFVISNSASLEGISDGYVAVLAGQAASTAALSENKQAEFLCPDYYDNYSGKTIRTVLSDVSFYEIDISSINDDFVNLKSQFSSVSELLEACRQSFDFQYEKLAEDTTKKILWHRVAEDATIISLPAKEVGRCRREYTDYYKELAELNNCTYEEYLKSQGLKPSYVEKAAEEYADERVRFETVAFAIAEEEELTLTQTQFEELALREGEKFGYVGYDEFKEYNDETSIYIYLTWKKAVDYIYEHAEFV